MAQALKFLRLISCKFLTDKNNPNRVGQDLTVYGKTFHIYDCDTYTREFFANLKQPQPEAQPYPSDSFDALPQKPVVAHDRDFVEHYLGGVRVQSQKQFLDNDRKVLRFYAKCEDLPVVIHYFLADDTVEVQEVHFSNDGCYPYPLLMKRQKLSKQPITVRQPGQAPLVQEYVSPADFFVCLFLRPVSKKLKTF